MRKMRLWKREINDKGEMMSVMEECQVLRIAAQDEEGMFIVPVNYGYECREDDGENLSLTFYIHSAKAGRKAEAFDKSPVVALEMDCGHEIIRGDYTCDYSFAYRSIMGSGRIRPVTDKAEKMHGLILLMKHVDPKSDLCFRDEMTEAVNVYRIDVEEFTGKMRQSC
ncbi:pyridoxamine 5'-phosphate oxidase family protein [Clostridium sp. AM58-1XD]|uniref:pyridoxamine 5'-phosphate oxidase family protein n=1 Tax=Clostridium sp. AM58-1XD TaxID=2292307 RepID=UPI000E491BD0|nr:pyridoxamine 5'-phosphate oxidase family protein [Clostridium sp. AM58-1XD]RGZ00971.1 pyridoxamine 5'-phosphate oxidase family protein [Clostridium sp. AM58-1XD]